ncbi:MAG: ABC transporter permease, partial [Pseudomonadota bacterium]
MLLNYFLMALYNLKRQPAFSAIKVLSLAMGLGCSVLVIMHVQYALSFDRHFPNSENIHRLVTGLTTDQILEFDVTSDAYAPQMKLDYPQIEYIAKIRSSRGFFARGDASSANDYHWAEPEIINIFSLQFLTGDSATALNEPNSVVLNQTAAAKYFPDEDPMGQTLTLDDQIELRVTGVMRDLPVNTHLDMEMLVSVATGRALFGENFMGGTAWVGFGGTLTYMTLPGEADAQAIAADLPAFLERNVPEQQRAFATANELRLRLQPLHDIYLSTRAGFGQTNNRPQILLGLGIFASLILLTSCINFANLSMAQVQQRNKEIGVRKTLGAKRGQIVMQFLCESILLTLVALLIALPAVYLVIPVYTNLTTTNFTFATALQAASVGLLTLFVLGTGLLSGLLPALALSRYEPATIIRGESSRRRFSGIFRSSVTVVQFGFSTALIILALAINLQIRHLTTMEIGFDKNNLIVLDSTFDQRNPENFNYDAMITDLRQHPGVLAVGKSSVVPPSTGPYNPWNLPSYAENEFRGVSSNIVDVGYFDAMGFKLLAGRWFSEEFGTDIMSFNGPAPADPANAAVRGAVITRYAASNFGFGAPEAALDQIIRQGLFRYNVIGVIEDFRQSGGL